MEDCVGSGRLDEQMSLMGSDVGADRRAVFQSDSGILVRSDGDGKVRVLKMGGFLGVSDFKKTIQIGSSHRIITGVG